MASENGKVAHRRSITITPGKPIEMAEPVGAADTRPASPLCIAMVATLKAYAKAARELVDGAFAGIRDLAPPNLRVPCHIYVVCCPDGVLVRYDAAEGEEPKVRSAEHPESLTKLAPLFSENLIHSPDDPAAYVPEHLGPGIIFSAGREAHTTEFARFHPIVIASKTLPLDFPTPQPPERPLCLAAVNREFHIQLHGEMVSSDLPGAVLSNPEQFIVYTGCPWRLDGRQ
jgi:hypothetical protein